MTYDDALDQVARKRNMDTWELLMVAYKGVEPFVEEKDYRGMVHSGYEEAAEILANASVKQDRESLLKLTPGQTITLSREVRTEQMQHVLNADFIRKLPLPFVN